MILTLDQLNACMPYAGERATVFLESLNTAMHEFDITTLARQSMFLAQVAHESGSLRYTREIHDGSNYDINVNPKLAETLGNTVPGDGKRFLGRGLIQITGRANTLACLAALGRRETDVEYLETPMGASRSAAWFFKVKGCNGAADVGNFWTVSKIVNGGTNGLDDRIKHYLKCRKALGI